MSARSRGFGVRLMLAPLERRKSRGLLSLAALALAACLVTSLLTLYRGVADNLSREFRGYGANLVVTPPPDETVIPTAAAVGALANAGAPGTGVLYLTGAEANGVPVVVVGADFERLRGLNPAWRVTGAGAASDGTVWVGVNAARQLKVAAGDRIALDVGGAPANPSVAGTVQSGGSEDDQIFTTFHEAARLSGLAGYTTLQLRVSGGAAAMRQVGARLAAVLPGAVISPVRPIALSEGRILLSTRALLIASISLILLTVGLCLAAALTGLAMERRPDFGLMKALGGGDATVMAAFIGEAALLGFVAAIVGIGAGLLVAGGMGMALFQLWLWPSAGIMGLALGVTLALAVLAAWLPWPIVRGVTPAAILRGE